jgi:hypothetical protein
MVTSTSLEILFYLLCELLNQNFDLDTTKTLILHVWFGFFFNGVHLTKLRSKKTFFMKTLSKLGALTIQKLFEEKSPKSKHALGGGTPT